MGDIERDEQGIVERLGERTSVTESVTSGPMPAGASFQDAPGFDEIGQMVREARKKKGWTLEETGRQAGIGRSTLSKIENGQTRPGFDIVRRLTQALGTGNPESVSPVGPERSLRPPRSHAGRAGRTESHGHICP